MPTITSTRHELETLAGIPCPIEQLPEQLELVKGEVKSHDPATDELRIELNDTNRPDLWSVEGIARQLRIKHTGSAADYPFFGKAQGAEGTGSKAAGGTGSKAAGGTGAKAAGGTGAKALGGTGSKTGGDIIVEESVAAVRPFVGGFVADGTSVTDPLLRGLIETQEKLSENYGQRRRSLAIGIYPARSISFPVTYRAVAPGSARFVPLGMDAELDLTQILERHPKGIAYGSILAGAEQYPLLVDAAGAILSFPPVINSRSVGEVRPGDSMLFVEATGTDLQTVLLALNVFAVNLADRGARIAPCVTRYPSTKSTPLGKRVVVPHPLERSVTVPVSEFHRLLGIDWSGSEIARTLRAYGCGVTARGKTLTVSTPPYRLDYLHPVDAIEDCAISAGYNALAPEMPAGFTVGALAPLTHLENRTRDRLVGYGFEETMANVLTDRAAEAERVGRSSAGLVEIANVMSEAYAVLRRSLVPSLLRVEAASATSLYPHRIFEVGECAVVDATRPEGSRTVSAVAAAISHATANFSELHSYLDRLVYDLGLSYRLEPAERPPFIAGRHAQIVVEETPVGEIGEIHPETLTAWGVRTPVAAFEMDLSQLLELLHAG